VHTFEPKFIEDKPSRVTYEIEPMGLAVQAHRDSHRFRRRSHPRDREGRLARDLEQSQVLLETGEALAIPRNS